MSEPVQGNGLYSKLLPVGQSAPAGGTGLPNAATLMQVRNMIWDKLLPESRLKSALLSASSFADIINVWKLVISGAKYSQGEYEVGAYALTKLRCSGHVSWSNVPDDFVPYAKKLMTMLMGVKIMNSVDLGRLTQGADAYYNNNPNRLDQPRSAVNRAVWLAQNVFNPYDDTCVDVRIFDKYPLVAPVPDMTQSDENLSRGKYFTGTGLNGQQFVNGLLVGGGVTGLTSLIQSGGTSAQSLSSMNMGTLQKYAPIIAILLVVGFFISIKSGLYKPNF